VAAVTLRIFDQPRRQAEVMPSALAVVGSYAASKKLLMRTRLVAMTSSGVS